MNFPPSDGSVASRGQAGGEAGSAAALAANGAGPRETLSIRGVFQAG